MSQRLMGIARVSLHSRINLSPFTKDFRGGEHLRVSAIFGCSAHSRATCACSKTEDFLRLAPESRSRLGQRGRKSWPFCPCLGLGGRQTIATFPVHNFKSWVSCVIVRFTKLKRVVMGETQLFKALSRLLRKVIQCFEAFGTPHAGDPCWSDWKCNKNSGQTCIKQPFTNPLQTLP